MMDNGIGVKWRNVTTRYDVINASAELTPHTAFRVENVSLNIE